MNEIYRPNGYSCAQAYDTIKTMDKIASLADIIVPGHGPAFRPNTVVRSKVRFNVEEFEEGNQPLIRIIM